MFRAWGFYSQACVVHLLVDCSYPRLVTLRANRARAKRLIRRTAHVYRIRLQRLMEVIVLEQRQLAGIFLIVLIVFFFVLWWLLAYQFRVLG